MNITKTFLVVACIFLCGMPSVYAEASGAPVTSAPADQEKNLINGVVIDDYGTPIIGASVRIAGSNTGAVTDTNGNFSISCKPGARLTISYIGYVSQEVKAQDNLRVTLQPDDKVLEDVVVTGYGTFKKSAYAGSATTIKTAPIKDVPTTSLNEMLQGASGVTMSSTSGQPGSATSISIRGMGSFNASNTPLYVIDGVPMISGNVSSTDSDGGLDVMSTLNPSDIESLTVIKDAAAASLYGSRAANGVVVITTKKGKEGKSKVNLKADWGYSDFAMSYRETLSGQERYDVIYNGYKEYYLRSGKTDEVAEKNAKTYADKYAAEPWCGYTDWHDVFFRKGSHQNYEASISGGTNKFKFYGSLNYYKQNGIATTSGLKRISGRINAEYQATKRLSVGYSGQLSDVDQDIYSEGTSYTAPFYACISKVTPSDPVYNEDGSWNQSLIANGDRNPALSQAYDTHNEKISRFMNTLWGQYEFINNLKFKSTVSYDYMTTKGKEWYDPRTSNGQSSNGTLYASMYERTNCNWANQLTYNISIAQDHHLDALLGYEMSSYKRDYISGESSNFASADKQALANGATVEGVGGYDTGYRMVSYLGRLNYDYQQKYFLGASMRVDGSSRLSEDSRWGTFWSVSGAWRFMEEKFTQPIANVLTDGKLRVSYGINGTLPSNYYGYMGLYSVSGSYQGNPALTPYQVANNNLSWEKNQNFNIGLDLTFLNRIRLTVEYYTRTTKDLLMDMPISMVSGYDSYLTNIGKVSNKGIEVELSADIIKQKDFTWTSTINYANNKNEIKTLDGTQTQIFSSPYVHQIGSSYYTYYLYEFAGIAPEDGNPMFYTNKKLEDGTLDRTTSKDYTECERVAYKHAEPTATGAWINTFHYKWFDLSFNIAYQFGGYSYDNWAQKTEACDATLNIPVYYRDAWKQAGDVTDIEVWMPSKSSTTKMSKIASTRRLHSSDFIRLRNLTFGVTAPTSWTKAIGIDHARFYVSGNNLLTWAAYDFYDPESGNNGFASWQTPPLKTITFGVDLTF